MLLFRDSHYNVAWFYSAIYKRAMLTKFVGKVAEQNEKNDLVGRNIQIHYKNSEAEVFPFDAARENEKFQKEDRFSTVSRLRESTNAEFDRAFADNEAQRNFMKKVRDESINKALSMSQEKESFRTVTEDQVKRNFNRSVDNFARSEEQATFLKNTLSDGIKKSYGDRSVEAPSEQEKVSKRAIREAEMSR